MSELDPFWKIWMSRNGANAHLRLPPYASAALWRPNAWTIQSWLTICAVPRIDRRCTSAAGRHIP